MRRVAVIIIALGLVAAACGDDDSSADTGSDDDGEAYIASVRDIGDDLDATLMDLFDAVGAGAEGQASETVLLALVEALDGAVTAQTGAIERFEALDPGDVYANDHALSLEFFRDQVDAWARQSDAAAVFDEDLVAEIDLELNALSRQLLSDLSPQFGEYVLADTPGDAVFETLVGRTGEEIAYLDAVALAQEEFAGRARQFSLALQRTYSSDELLLRALLDAGAGEAWAAVRDAAVEIDPPSSYDDAHQDLLELLEELVRLDTIIAEAAEAGDVVGFEVANVGLSFAGGRWALEAPPELAAAAAWNIGSFDPDGLPGGEYGIAVADALRTFNVLALDVPIATGVFPIVSDENLMTAIVEIEPVVVELTRDTADALDAVTPPDEYGPGHERLRTYFEELIELRTTILDEATESDAETLRELGALGGLLRDRAESRLWCSARADLVDDAIWPITQITFDRFGPPVEQMCPA